MWGRTVVGQVGLRFAKGTRIAVAGGMQLAERILGVINRSRSESFDNRMQLLLARRVGVVPQILLGQVDHVVELLQLTFQGGDLCSTAFCASDNAAAMFSKSAPILGNCSDCAPRDLTVRCTSAELLIGLGPPS